ncbi:unknown [Phocaeicola coprophilus CAG:333]|nr:unknown [Phocaeicola coprophilus CAG:333]
MPQAYVLRIQFQGPLIVFNSTFIILLANPGNTSHLISIYDERIPFKCFRAVTLGTRIVIQIHFRQSPIEIRISQIWFRIDYLIKILDRKNVIFKIKSVLSDSHHPIRINLGKCRNRDKYTYI